MAPLYGIDALLSLTFDNASPILNVVRDCYEAFTLYNFVKMLYVWLGGERAVIQKMSEKKQVKLLFPLTWMEPWEMGDEMFYNSKFGVLQYSPTLTSTP
ncbi:organic solute transporter subunit alpha/Transmembrane protein [Baffinella frigidus]|nr:organic solute transporter subunit alpha/Transmembrane protein [Cryptophyta sp. CCMP2293]